jgi:hypothetical protein
LQVQHQRGLVAQGLAPPPKMAIRMAMTISRKIRLKTARRVASSARQNAPKPRRSGGNGLSDMNAP